jgi:hypothetical protein
VKSASMVLLVLVDYGYTTVVCEYFGSFAWDAKFASDGSKTCSSSQSVRHCRFRAKWCFKHRTKFFCTFEELASLGYSLAASMLRYAILNLG